MRRLHPTESVTDDDDGQLRATPALQVTARTLEGRELYLGAAAVFLLRLLCAECPASETEALKLLQQVAPKIGEQARRVAVRAYMAGLRP